MQNLLGQRPAGQDLTLVQHFASLVEQCRFLCVPLREGMLGKLCRVTELEGLRGHLIRQRGDRATQRQGQGQQREVSERPSCTVPGPCLPALLSGGLEKVLVCWAPSRDSWHPMLTAHWPWFQTPFLLGAEAAWGKGRWRRFSSVSQPAPRETEKRVMSGPLLSFPFYR